MTANIVWREEWKRPYESVWSLFENLKIANSVTGSDLLFYIANKRGRTHVNKLSEETHTKLKELTRIDFNEINQSMLKLSKFERNNPLHYFHTHLCYCVECVRYNFHSYLHQYKLVDICPFHLSELKRNCEVCEKEIYYFNFAFHIPFTCKCGAQLYQTVQEPVWKNWAEFNPCLDLTILDENSELTDREHSLQRLIHKIINN
ncbi:TniQ protein [Paenibacillus taihuensis]|uniref:TniQ protein n=1 Tax=Paenibacillus taihuensis TaxID=1156355 RepID=A0A3D9QUR9_9BACL|nr:TniQ family protein [Paenibacillus taihuensis]REE67645.1 TniQ protein [Paenibacillus taihuensis]